MFYLGFAFFLLTSFKQKEKRWKEKNPEKGINVFIAVGILGMKYWNPKVF